jgi:hypothetical protein
MIGLDQLEYLATLMNAYLSMTDKILSLLVVCALIQTSKKLQQGFLGPAYRFVDTILGLDTTGGPNAGREGASHPGPGPMLSTWIKLLIEVWLSGWIGGSEFFPMAIKFIWGDGTICGPKVIAKLIPNMRKQRAQIADNICVHVVQTEQVEHSWNCTIVRANERPVVVRPKQVGRIAGAFEVLL